MRISGMLAQVSIFAGLLIQVQCQSSSAVTTIPPVSRERLNFTKLAVTCREQSGKKQCPKGEQFCTETNDCPEEHICTCTKWCQHLLCVIPAARDVCRWHPVPRNGYIIQKSTFLEFRCNHGYVVEEPRNKTCENGEWKPNDRHPTCKAVQCGSHPLLENGLMMFDPADCPEEFKTRVYFFCNPGYTLVGASHRVCTASQRWSGDMPSCRRDGQWGNWSEWSNCEITCGSGRQVRFRRCNAPQEGGKECEGLAMETRICFAARACRVTKIGCFSFRPWKGDLKAVQLQHTNSNYTHHCLNYCAYLQTVYAAVRSTDSCWCFNDTDLNGYVVGCRSSYKPLYELYRSPKKVPCTRWQTRIEPVHRPYVAHISERSTVSCGLWGTHRCNYYRKVAVAKIRTVYKLARMAVSC